MEPAARLPSSGSSAASARNLIMALLSTLLLIVTNPTDGLRVSSPSRSQQPFVISPFPYNTYEDENDQYYEQDEIFNSKYHDSSKQELTHEILLDEMERLLYEHTEDPLQPLHRINKLKKKKLLKFGDENPDMYLTAPELIAKYGYPIEIHNVSTADGYILQMHRIKHGKNKTAANMKGEGKQRVVFLQHGMFGTSADWVLNSVEKSLAYMLADEGYDVWLGNARGNIYSQRHVSLKPSAYKFWKFSWHEMGYYDLASEIDHVLNVTNSKDIYYVGHSMGTTMFFVLMSTRPEYNEKIRVMAALGPAVYLNNTKSSAKFFARWWGPVEKTFLDTIGHGILLPKIVTKLINKFAPEFCTEELRADRLCEEIMSLLTGHDPAQANYTQLPVILAHEPSTVSTRTGFHYFQSIRTGEFREYNNGFRHQQFGKSQQSSSLTLPPKYNLTNVKVPVALFWGQNDILCDPTDVERLSKTLPNIVLYFKVNFTLFNHIDFVFAKDVDILVNRPLLQFLQKY